ncbi:MBL fold metallo-hydrolase [Clostridium sp. UBA7503]|uniref:MBL fold metallo-hydrolase n=1 Tax=Clostridium sp. UBA7503 TaxID=1946377 RepID=UPI0032170B3D
MVITWFGHSCFLLENSHGEKILMDPFNKCLGGTPYKGSVDIVTISHDHFDHNYTDLINPGAIIINTPCSYESSSIKIQGFPSYHDNIKGAKRGDNIIYLIETDSLKLCHLGDLGHMLAAEELDLLGTVDILFIPVGSNFTIAPEIAATLCNKIQSKLVIPMHYKVPHIDFPVHGIENFISFMKNAVNLKSHTLAINQPLEGVNLVKIFEL